MPDDVVTSLRQLAVRVGRVYTAVREWTLRDDWPWPRPPECWPLRVADVEAWAARTLVRDPASGGMDNPDGEERTSSDGGGEGVDPLKRLRMLKLEQEVERLRATNSQLHARLIDRSDVQSEISGLIANWRSAIIAEAGANIDELDSAGAILEGRRDDCLHTAIERAENLCRRFAREMMDSVRDAK